MAELREGVAGVPGEGAYIILRLSCEAGSVTRVDFECNGCPAAQACCSALALIGPNRSLSHLRTLNEQDLLVLVGGLPEGKERYATLTITALQAALGAN